MVHFPYILWLAALAAAVLAAVLLLFLRPDQEEAVPASAAVERIPLPAALERLRKGEKAILLDVRTPEEYAEKHLPDSVLVPLGDEGTFAARASAVLPDPEAVIFVYCRSGRRSQIAAELLAGAGYRRVTNIGGIIELPPEKE